MAQHKPFVLMQGTFTPSEAKDIVHSVFMEKISFHALRSFQMEEKKGEPDKPSLKRIKDLKKNLSRLEKVLDQAHKKKEMVTLFSEVEIQLKSASKSKK